MSTSAFKLHLQGILLQEVFPDALTSLVQRLSHQAWSYRHSRALQSSGAGPGPALNKGPGPVSFSQSPAGPETDLLSQDFRPSPALWLHTLSPKSLHTSSVVSPSTSSNPPPL